ncbi:MAG: integrase core domain-containing protein [Planctomycetota bacterium]
MKEIMTPLSLLITALAAWLNERNNETIDFLREEVATYQAIAGTGRLPFTDDQRRRLAVKGTKLGRKRLMELPTLVQPDTILAWHRKLVAKKHDYSAKRGPGRPSTRADIQKLIVRMARENPGWGYTRIMGALANLGHTVCRTTIADVLKAHGLEPACERNRKPTWVEFLRAHWDVLAATDFFSVEVWTPKGLVTYYVLFVIELSTRKIDITGITPNPGAAFMAQMARNLVDDEDGFLRDKRYLIHDRDSKHTEQFLRILSSSDVKSVRLPRRSPNLNAYAERFVLSIKSECLDKLILFGERSLRRVCDQFVRHYHTERNHQGLENRLIDGRATTTGSIRCNERLGGLLKYYHRAA